jgi:hypothetical protein
MNTSVIEAIERQKTTNLYDASKRPPVVSISTTRETPSALGLLGQDDVALAGGVAACFTLTLLTFTALSGSSCRGAVITKFSDHAVTFRSSPTVLADTPMSRSTSTRILSGKPPRAMWSAAMFFGLYRIGLPPLVLVPLIDLVQTAYNFFTSSATG